MRTLVVGTNPLETPDLDVACVCMCVCVCVVQCSIQILEKAADGGTPAKVTQTITAQPEYDHSMHGRGCTRTTDGVVVHIVQTSGFRPKTNSNLQSIRPKTQEHAL